MEANTSSRIEIINLLIEDLRNESAPDSIAPARLSGIYKRIIDLINDEAQLVDAKIKNIQLQIKTLEKGIDDLFMNSATDADIKKIAQSVFGSGREPGVTVSPILNFSEASDEDVKEIALSVFGTGREPGVEFAVATDEEVRDVVEIVFGSEPVPAMDIAEAARMVFGSK